jgi:hypothetical protein
VGKATTFAVAEPGDDRSVPTIPDRIRQSVGTAQGAFAHPTASARLEMNNPVATLSEGLTRQRVAQP